MLDVDREATPLRLDDRRTPEERRDRRRVQRGRHDDELQVVAHLAPYTLREREGKIAAEAPLVELVEHDGTDAFEQRVVLEAPEQDAFRHHEQPCGLRRLALEAHLVADRLADGLTALVGDATGGSTRRDTTRLEHENRARDSVEQGRRHARRLAGAGGGLQDDRTESRERCREVGQDGIDGKGFAAHVGRVRYDPRRRSR